MSEIINGIKVTKIRDDSCTPEKVIIIDLSVVREVMLVYNSVLYIINDTSK